jgi:hypothetical protein
VGGDDFPITVGVFLFSTYPVRPFRLFLQKFTIERQNCCVVVWVRTGVAWCVQMCRVVAWHGVSCCVVAWCGVVSFLVSTYNTKVSISYHEKFLHRYSKVPATYLH